MIAALPDARDSIPLIAECRKYTNRICLSEEHDVKARYWVAAKGYNADVIIRVTGDCPLISPELCGAVVFKLKELRADYASNIMPRTFPKGMDCEAFTFETLDRAMQHEVDEHVTTWMRKDRSVRRVNVTSPWPMDGRLCLDTEDDYAVICAAFGHEPYQRLKAA